MPPTNLDCENLTHLFHQAIHCNGGPWPSANNRQPANSLRRDYLQRTSPAGQQWTKCRWKDIFLAALSRCHRVTPWKPGSPLSAFPAVFSCIRLKVTLESSIVIPNRILKVFVVIFWIKTIHPTNSSWALSREPLKFRLNFRNGSRGTSTRGEGICHEGRQRKSILAQCAHHRAQPVALIARILLCGAHCTALFCFWPRSSFYSGNSGARLVFSFFKYRIWYRSMKRFYKSVKGYAGIAEQIGQRKV